MRWSWIPLFGIAVALALDAGTQPAGAVIIGPGGDYWETPPGGFVQNFSVSPIPADFFNPGSDPFVGVVQYYGSPIDPVNLGTTDTIIQRLAPLNLPDPPPSIDTIPIELLQLSLVSTNPIVVTYVVGPPELWTVNVSLSIIRPPQGQMTVTKSHPNGGVFSSQFNVLPRFTFTEVSNPGNQRVLDTGVEGRPPVILQSFGPPPWVHTCDPQMVPAGTNFCPGIATYNDRVPAQYAGPGVQATLLTACYDNDVDGVGGCVDNCPSWSNPGQNLPPWPLPPSDPDCDGFTSADESTIGTDPVVQCDNASAPPDWPPDFDDSKMVDISDVLALKLDFGGAVPPASARLDIYPDLMIDISDALALKPLFGAMCT